MWEAARCKELCTVVGNPGAPMPHYDVLTSLVAQMFDVPVVLITLLDGDYAHVASGVGVSPSDPKLRREQSFCAWSLLPLTPEVLIVPDALQDKRFCTVPRVAGPPNIRFYAGAPLVTSTSHRIGSLCLIDFSPRTLDGAGANMLCNFAEMIARDMEYTVSQRRSLELHPRKSLSMRYTSRTSEAVIVVDTTKGWKVLFANSQWQSLYPQIVRGSCLWDHLSVLHGTKESTQSFNDIAHRRKAFTTYVELEPSSAMTSRGAQKLVFKPANSQALNDGKDIRIQVPWLTDASEDNGLYFAIMDDKRASGDDSGVVEDVRDDWPIESLKIGSLLGRGSFGVVYKGWYMDVSVAIKVLPLSDDAIKETRIGTTCHHANIVRTLDSAVAGSEVCLVMELCDNGSLQRGIDAGLFRIGKNMQNSTPDMARLDALLTDIASALHYMHGRRVVHSDLSANNVLLVSLDTTARVTDFGMSHELGTAEEITGVKQYGTVTHMPVELLKDGILGTFTDIYSFGVIMWELYMSQRPWAGLRHAQVIAAKLYKSQTLQFAESVPQAYESLCSDCMSVDFRSRPSASEVLERLEAFV